MVDLTAYSLDELCTLSREVQYELDDRLFIQIMEARDGAVSIAGRAAASVG